MTAINFPDSPSLNETFVVGDKTYEWNGTQWVVKSSAASGVDLSALDQTILPDTNEAYDLGSSSKRFRDVYLSGSSIDLGGAQITSDGSAITLPVGSSVGDSELGSGGATVYATIDDLPLSGVDNGSFALVSATNRLYVWTNSGWYNIALINQTPTITGTQAAYQLAIDGTATTVTLTGTDAEGLPITWSAVTSGDTNVATVTNTDNVFTITPSTDTADQGTLTVTFRASDGVNIGTATSEFTLAFVSSYWDETVLSIDTSSTDGLNNSTFIDRSTNAHTVTASGSPIQTAFHPYLDNWSVEFDGSSYAVAGVNTDWTVLHNNSSTWTVSFNCFLKDATDHAIMGTNSNSVGGAHGFWVQINSSGGINGAFTRGVDGARLDFSSNDTGLFSVGTWHTFSLTFDHNQAQGSKFSMVLNGVSYTDFTEQSIVGNSNSSSDFSFSSSAPVYPLYLAATRGSFSGITRQVNAYFSDFRITVDNTLKLQCFGSYDSFRDKSTNEYTITVTGDPKISTFNPFGQESEYAVEENKGSVYFEAGQSNFLSLPNDSSLDFGTGDWTISFWINSPSSFEKQYSGIIGDWYGNYTIVSGDGQSAGEGKLGLMIENYSGTTNYATSTTVVHDGSWHHCEVSVGSRTLRIFVDGVLETTADVSSYSFGRLSDNFTVGAFSHNTSLNFDGYLSDIRVVKGQALHTSDFTPPTAPVGNTNASLYLPMDNPGIFDKTGNNTLTPVGNASTSATQTKFADTAMYFDGSGDYLTIPDSSLFAFGSGDFTIEAWIYANSLGSYNGVIGQWPDNGSTANNSFVLETVGTNIDFYWVSGTTLYTLPDIGAIALNQWIHVAVARNGNSIYGFIDGSLAKTGSITQTLNDSSSAITVGGNVAGGGGWNGYIEDVQILKGVAKYTTNFTPPNSTQGRTYQAES